MSGSLSNARKSEVQSWVEAGIWLDIVLGTMVIGSVAGLVYSLLGR